jgi:alpha-tubulin suppressor-like RCC1 family protein
MPEVQARVFKEALKLMDNQAYDEALVILEQLISYNYVDAVSKAEECREILNRLAAATTFSAGNVHSVAVKNDGTVVCAADSIPIDGRVNVDAWRDEDIVSVAAGGTLTLGLRRDGTVVVAGMVDSRRISAPDWQNIISVDAGNAFTVGLKADGTVVSFGHGNDGQCDVDSWTGIKAIATGVRHTAGLRTDGTVVITGYGAERQSRELAELYEEDNPIVAISAGGGWPDDPGNGHTCVLRRDGTVRVVESRNESFRLSDVEKWYNPDTDEPSRKIIAISSGDWHIVGLRTDGTVVTTYPTEEAIAEWGIKSFSSDIKDLDSWTDIVAISAGNGYTLALQDSGAVLSCGFSAGRPEDGAWTDIGIG